MKRFTRGTGSGTCHHLSGIPRVLEPLPQHLLPVFPCGAFRLGLWLAAFLLLGSAGFGNEAPLITAQSAIATTENAPVEIQLSHLSVTDADNVYPDDFSLTVHAGTGYSVDGATVTPDAGLTGTLTVPVHVNDGTDDSNTFDLAVAVAPAPHKAYGMGNNGYGRLGTNDHLFRLDWRQTTLVEAGSNHTLFV